jgi:ubiquinone/menaquinone biosynthesis C-methylase UbiE
VEDETVFSKSAAYREASEALHRAAPSWDRRAAHYRMLWECGYADLIRTDFYRLFGFVPGATGRLLDAGCGTGIDVINLQRQAAGLQIHGVDVSSAPLARAVAQPNRGNIAFYQAALEHLPFSNEVFDYIASHEVIEHAEDPAAVMSELGRVLKPGGVCVIATPNGASLWIEHLRQQLMRLLGRRGASIGEDHTRSPTFWRRQFGRAGMVVERQIFDGAALEFQLFVAPARWMPILSRLFESLRVVPLINLLLCDRVKFRLRKLGSSGGAAREVTLCCPVCRAVLEEQPSGVVCGNGHRFARTAIGVIDFTTLVHESNEMAPSAMDPAMEPSFARPTARPEWLRRLRRAMLLALSVCYAAILLALVPLALAVGWFRQPFQRRRWLCETRF